MVTRNCTGECADERGDWTKGRGKRLRRTLDVLNNDKSCGDDQREKYRSDPDEEHHKHVVHTCLIQVGGRGRRRGEPLENEGRHRSDGQQSRGDSQTSGNTIVLRSRPATCYGGTHGRDEQSRYEQSC